MLSSNFINALLLLACICCWFTGAVACKASEPRKPMYLGCYQDKEGSPDLARLAGGEGLGGRRVNRNLCEFLCRGFGSKYFGLQGGGDCYCGDTYGKYGVADADSCDKNCRGSPEEICGGIGVNSVYQIAY